MTTQNTYLLVGAGVLAMGVAVYEFTKPPAKPAIPAPSANITVGGSGTGGSAASSGGSSSSGGFGVGSIVSGLETALPLLMAA